MPTNHITAIDNRGFFFLLPKLGIDENAHGLCAVKAAVGPLALANTIAAQLSGPTPQLKERKAADDCKFVTVSFRGGMWHLPKVAPQGKSSDIEIFAVYAKRIPTKDWPDLTAVKLRDDQSIVCLPCPAYVLPQLKTLAELMAEHPNFLEDTLAGLNMSPPPPSSSSRLPPGPRPPTAAELDIEKTFSDWELTAGGKFRPEWYNKVRLPGKAETVVSLGYLHDAAGEVVGVTYALRREGDEDEQPGDGEFKPMPREAMLPGLQRALVNLARHADRTGPLRKVGS